MHQVGASGISPDLLSGFPEGQVVAFALVLLRIGAFTVAMPITGTSSVPAPVKVLWSLVLSVVIFPVASVGGGAATGVQSAVAPLAISEMVILWALREVVLGLFLGFVVRFFFFAVSVAGELLGVTSGLGASQLFNPSLGTNSNILEQFEVLLATLLFLALNGHHFFIEGIARSFSLHPVGRTNINVLSFGDLGPWVQQIIVSGIQIAAPVMISIFLAHLAMGIVGRVVPQVNVLVTSLQMTILASFLVLFISLPSNTETMGEMMDQMAGQFTQAMKAIGR
ncbi:MAG: flagellar biosynthetic protein FliR [Bdellovibrio sp.]|nr:MAG: flagellar biosynthetic protein FliR [Bdellovibrio sp.]